MDWGTLKCVDMYTTDTPLVDGRPIVAAFLVWAGRGNLAEALKALEGKAERGGGTAIVGLRISGADGTYHVPGETFVGGGTTQRDMSSPGHTVERKIWVVYGTAIRRQGDDDPRREFKRNYDDLVPWGTPRPGQPRMMIDKWQVEEMEERDRT